MSLGAQVGQKRGREQLEELQADYAEGGRRKKVGGQAGFSFQSDSAAPLCSGSPAVPHTLRLRLQRV